MAIKTDNLITRYIRPATLIWTICLFTFLVVMDSSFEWFNVKPSFIDVFNILFTAEIGFYFTSRGIEKINAIREETKRIQVSSKIRKEVSEDTPEMYDKE